MQYLSISFIKAVLFILIESILVLLLVVNFSLISNKVISVLSVLALYMSGNVLDTVRAIAIGKDQKWLIAASENYRYIL